MLSKKLISKALEISYALKGKKQTGRQFHITFAFYKNRIHAIGINDYHRHHPRKRFGVYKAFKGNNDYYQPSLHSEIDALIKLGENNCKQFTFLNVRVGNNGNINLAKPCENCQEVLKQINFRKFYFTDSNGKIQEWI